MHVQINKKYVYMNYLDSSEDKKALMIGGDFSIYS